MKRSGPLTRTVPLARTPGLPRSPREPGKGKPLGPGRDTGPDKETRQAVYDRDSQCCVCCGRSTIGRPRSVGHRQRRSQGGSNDLSNLLLFLGLGRNPLDPDDHHARIDNRRDPEDEDRGLTVRSGQDPARVPVTRARPDGSRITQWPTDDGQWTDEDPLLAGAA